VAPLWRTVQPIDQAIGLRMVRLCELMLKPVFITDALEYEGIQACLAVCKTIYGAL
jgi:hypothetical protein